MNMLKSTNENRCRYTFKYSLLFITFCSLLFLRTSAQTPERKWNIGVMGGISLYAGDLGNNITKFNPEVFSQNWVGGISVSRYINPSFDAMLNGVYGTWGYYDNAVTIFKGNMVHSNLSLKYKFNNGYMLAEQARLSPYIFGGIGGSYFSGDRITEGWDFPFIGGAALKFRFDDVTSVTYQATVAYMNGAHNNRSSVPPTVASGNDFMMLHTFGLAFNLGSSKDEDKDGVTDRKDQCSGTPKGVKVDVTGCPVDGDMDGVADYLDQCPAEAGLASTKGCPDKDKDGVADKNDQCPNEAGPIALNGCPDADQDGITDAKDECPNVKGTLALNGCPDKDGDGIRDEEDRCPDVKGVALFKGCPDTDNDGIEDSKDMCPLLKGTVNTNGCPDTDNDGVHDGIDKCPAVSGSATHSGCPDSDGDGIYDDIDKCISLPGTPAGGGCPELKKETKQLFQKALQGIQFETGKAVIKPVSYPILKAIVKVMNDNPSYKLKIAGHTDDVGEDDMNMTLSQNRASSVADYLISSGVDPLRVTSVGYGETVPVDTNKSVKGRTRNRRVELSVEFIQVKE